MTRSWKALAVPAATAVAVLALSTSASAGNSPSAPAWRTTLGSPTWSGTLTALYPDAQNDIERVPFTVANDGQSDDRLGSVTASIATAPSGDAETAAGADIAGCRASWFAVSVERAGAAPADIAAGRSYTGTIDLAMLDSGTDQYACRGARPAVVVTAG